VVHAGSGSQTVYIRSVRRKGKTTTRSRGTRRENLLEWIRIHFLRGLPGLAGPELRFSRTPTASVLRNDACLRLPARNNNALNEQRNRQLLKELWQLEYDGKDLLAYTGTFRTKVQACAKCEKNFSDYQKLTMFLLLCKKAALNWVRREKSIIRMIPAAGLNLIMDYFVNKFRHRIKHN
jgi:hypothetical protein